jgi:hypothetical protein
VGYVEYDGWGAGKRADPVHAASAKTTPACQLGIENGAATWDNGCLLSAYARRALPDRGTSKSLRENRYGLDRKPPPVRKIP